MSGGVVPSDLAFARGRIAVAHAGAYGPVGTVLDSRGALEPTFSLHLSAALALPPVLPRLAWFGAELVGLHLDARGVVLRSLPEGEPVVLAPEARALALATDGASLVSAIVDGEGLHLGLHRGVVPSTGERALVVRRPDLRDVVEVVFAGACWHVFYAPVDEAVLGVVRWDGVAVREVRHPLRAPARSLHAATTGRRTAVAVGQGTDAIELAVLDAEGNARERPHVALRAPGSVLEHPRLVWTGRGFGLAALDREREALVLRPSGEGAGPEPLELAGARGPVGVAFYAEELIVASVESEGEEACLVLRSCDRTGGQAQTHRLAIAPADTALRGRALAAEARVEAARALVGGALYRDGTLATRSLEAAIGFRAAARDHRLELRVRPIPEAGFAVEARAAGASLEDEDEEAPTSLARLARWVRGTFSPEARAEAARDRELAAALVAPIPGASAGELLRVGASVRLTFTVQALPDASALGRLLAEVARHRAASLTSRPASAKPSSRGEEQR